MTLYKCEFPDCTNESKIRSKIKDRDSEYYGLSVCNYHANLLRPKKISEKTKRTKEKRKEQRKDYPEFYKIWCEIAQKSRCEECHDRLRGDSTEVCHIIAKSTNPEVAVNGENILLLCGFYSKNQCHKKFDKSMESRKDMKVFEKSLEQFRLIQNLIIKKSAEVLFYEKYL